MKRKIGLAAASVGAALAVGLAAIGGAAATPEEDARKAADAWLKLVDDAQYGKAYDAAAALLKSAAKKADFEAAVEKARAPLGKVKSRTLKSATATKSLPGAPAGDYVVIQFDLAAEKGAAVETITPMLEKDGKWRVSGYFLK
ncbi:MAG TPA: DUF4019 domain-containing protein [Myxococcota bacterium]|nr:DUF4019 domain-containing protein [Myxococcota bacterium]